MYIFKWIKAVLLKEFSKGDHVCCQHRGDRVDGVIDRFFYDEDDKCVYYRVYSKDNLTCFWKKGSELNLKR